jgi:hypothetical protein
MNRFQTFGFKFKLRRYNMGAGKAAAQCCHATLGVYQSLEARPPLNVGYLSVLYFQV